MKREYVQLREVGNVHPAEYMYLGKDDKWHECIVIEGQIKCKAISKSNIKLWKKQNTHKGREYIS